MHLKTSFIKRPVSYMSINSTHSVFNAAFCLKCEISNPNWFIQAPPEPKRLLKTFNYTTVCSGWVVLLVTNKMNLIYRISGVLLQIKSAGRD